MLACSSRTSSGWGSLTFSTSSDSPNSPSAVSRISAPWARNCASENALPTPAPDCTSTSCPRKASSRTPAGVIATRYSSALISLGTPILIDARLLPRWGGQDGQPAPSLVERPRSPRELPAAQRQPELDPVARAGEAAPGELLDAADAVAERVPVAVEGGRRALPMAVLLDEHVERAQQLLSVVALPFLDRPEHGSAVGAERVVVLQREQQLEGSEVLVGGDLGRLAVAQAHRLQRAAGLVEGHPQRVRRRGPAR